MNKLDCIKIKTCASKLPLVDSEKKLCVLVYPVISALGSLRWDGDCEASLGDKTLFLLPLISCVSEKGLVFTVI